jgi:hypothetical protein
MPLQLLKYNPGIVKDITEYAAGKNGPFYVDGDLVRFKNGYPQKFGGWQKDVLTELDAAGATTTTATSLQGVPRKVVNWRAVADGEDRLAVGTHTHLYIVKNNSVYDITPLRKTSTNLSNPLATTDGSATITVTDNSHGAQVGDYVVIEEATATGGITADTLNRKAGYEIETVTTNTFTITAPSNASSTVSSGGGTALDIKYLIGIDAGLGKQSSDPALGWGVGGWGEGTWNTPRSQAGSDVRFDNSSWTLNLWGEDLLAGVRNGAIYYYDTSAGESNRAVLLSGISGADSVPSIARVTAISFPDRHFIAAGCQEFGGAGNVDEMLVRFSDQEDFANFRPTATNTAGDQRLQLGTKIISMISAREEMIISTDEAIYGMTFVGPPFTFQFRLLATDAGAGGLNTMVQVDGDVYWMGKRQFYFYDGIVKELPCPVQHFVFDRMQRNFIDKVTAGHNKKFKEVIWFYVSDQNSAGSTNPENDSYVIYNYGENNWSIGTLDRSSWNDAFGFRQVPFAFDANGFLYDHETGTSDDGSAMNCHIETAPREISQDGNDMYMIDRIIPDTTMTSDTTLAVSLNTRKHPQGTETTKGAFNITSSTDKISVRAKGRQISMKFASSGTTDDWTLGDFRVNVRKDGLR